MEPDLDVCDLAPPPARGIVAPPARGIVVPPALAADTLLAPSAVVTRPTRREVSSLIAQPSRPLPAGFGLPYFTPYCYSPRGTSPQAKKSRYLRDLVKHADSATLAHCARRIAALIDAAIAHNFIGPHVVLVPVPRRAAYDPRAPRSAPEAIARALHAAGHGKVIWPALRRLRSVPKSAWSRPGSRPEFIEHYTSLELIDQVPPASQLLLVDDFVTRGRTLLAAAAVLYQAVPRASISAFALVRTEGLAPDIAAITAPTIGAIRHLGGDAFRFP